MPHAAFAVGRRRALGALGVTAAAAALAPWSARAFAGQAAAGRVVTRGRLRQSASRWCYKDIPLPELCRAVAAMGVPAIDLLEPDDWPVVRDHGLVCSMGYGGGGTISDGLNNPANHDRIVANLTAALPKARALGVPNLITFFGNRQGRSDAEAIAACVAGLNRLKGVAEDHGVTICVELLNSKVNHPDYHGDRTAFGVDVVGAVNSPRVKLLYDVYHMQIMEGDVIRTIRTHAAHIAHYHTGGVPGRHELDDTQELQWPAVCRAIVDTGFSGYLAHEFVPTRDPLTSLREAVALCDV
ncbi:MAG: hydroxypyruvate isomerase family protein [Vicinamibacterales bacterium]